MTAVSFTVPPSALSAADFIARFGAVYEHSPWVAEAVAAAAQRGELDDVTSLASAMAAVVNAAPHERQWTLIRAHPDLAGRAALCGELTTASTNEQASAGIDQCTAAEFARFQHYNAAYRQRFDFPFIMAVRGCHREQILAAFKARLQHDAETEFATAIDQIHKIARLRLEALAATESP